MQQKDYTNPKLKFSHFDASNEKLCMGTATVVQVTRYKHTSTRRCPRGTLQAGDLVGLPFEGPTSTLTWGCSDLTLESAVTQFKKPRGEFPHAILGISFPKQWQGKSGASRVAT